jgi:alkanesulfonate monooxygenase SsuD/methylene tetrahydromethanopterin reductase-like flavin-dependent oxidoreductase (luciferase family)
MEFKMANRNKIRFGLAVSAQMIPFPAAVEQCRRAEALGYDIIYMGDSFYNGTQPQDPMFDAWTTLAALATQTTTVRLGTMVTNFISRHPTLVARQAHSVDHISGGRLDLGIGAGGTPSDHTMAGVESWSTRERVDRFREATQIVDRMLRNEVSSFEGQYYRTLEAVLRPKSVQQPRPPITIAAHGDRMLRIAAEFADSWNTFALRPANRSTSQPLRAEEAFAEVRRQSTQLDRYCADLNRDPDDIRRSLFVGWDMAEAPNESVDAFHEFLGKYLEIGITEFILMWFPDGYQEVMGERMRLFSDEMIERIALEAIPAYRN